MTLENTLSRWDVQKRSVAAILQLVLAGILVFGLVTMRLGTAVTAGLALGITLLPALLERQYDYTLNPGLLLWLTLAVSIHTAGSIGLYERFQAFDHVAHTVSAMVIAGLGYASFRALELHSDDIAVPSKFRPLFILVFVLAMGVFWEVIEFSLGDLIKVYGVNDIVGDMIFNTLGAVIVAIWGTEYVGGLVYFFRQRLRTT